MFSTKSSHGKKGFTEFVLVCAVGFLGLSAVIGRPGMQITVMPGSVVRGERLLDEKGCLHCHAVNGRGGNRAPGFTRSSSRANTPALFASVMWNHSPKMLNSNCRDVPFLPLGLQRSPIFSPTSTRRCTSLHKAAPPAGATFLKRGVV